jgi:hypothetical protein
MLISKPERTKTRFAQPSLPSGSSFDWKRLKWLAAPKGAAAAALPRFFAS